MGWTMRSCTGPEIFEGLTQEERIGAMCDSHGGGSFVVHVNNYGRGSGPPKKLPISTGFFARWRMKRGGGPFAWSWQAHYEGAGCASTESNRAMAVREAKAWIDKTARERL